MVEVITCAWAMSVIVFASVWVIGVMGMAFIKDPDWAFLSGALGFFGFCGFIGAACFMPLCGE